MTDRTGHADVIVDEDALTNAALIERGGHQLLVLNPAQSSGGAADRVQVLLPTWHPDRVRALVRAHLPNAVDFDDEVARLPRPKVVPPPLVSRWSVWRARALVTVGAVGLVLAMGGGYALSREPASEPVDRPFQSTLFATVLDELGVDCDDSGGDPTVARCVDREDGSVMAAESITADTFEGINFSYGPDKIAVRAFLTEDAAQTFASEAANARIFANLHGTGRVVLFGTDAPRIQRYMTHVT